MEFHKFATTPNYKPIYTKPLHPQSNGQVESFVQTVKKKPWLRKALKGNGNINIRPLTFRNTTNRNDKSSSWLNSKCIYKCPTRQTNNTTTNTHTVAPNTKPVSYISRFHRQIKPPITVSQ